MNPYIGWLIDLYPNETGLALWLLPLLKLNPNRDLDLHILTRKAESYFAYGQVVHRGGQVHLFGRWHIDRKNAMLFGEYGLPGVLEQAACRGWHHWRLWAGICCPESPVTRAQMAVFIVKTFGLP